MTNTETVVVQKFLDANTNNVIDAGDLLVQQFNLSDGTNFVIGGVTNLNVPGDMNSTAGAITAQLNLNADFSQRIIGKYVFKLSSPVGHFTQLTNLFAVTNFPFAQKFTGTIVSNGLAVPNAVVILFPAPRPGNHGPGNPQAAGVANNAGFYTVPVPQGTYVLLAFKSNYVADYTASPVLTLGSGATVSTNVVLTNATASISAKYADAANSSIGLPGMLMPVTANGLITVNFTDTNGNFTARVGAGQWELDGQTASLIVNGYVGLQNNTNVNAGATGITFDFPKATALFYGSVKGNFGNPLPAAHIYASDSNSNLYSADAYADGNGNYVAGIVGMSNDPWQVQADNNQPPNLANYIFSQPQLNQSGGTNINAGQAVLQNFTAILATNHITGNVKSSGTNIVGVGVYASATINSVDYSVYVDTDTTGTIQ